MQFLGHPVWRVWGTGTQGIPSHIQEPSQEPSFFESKMFGKIYIFFFLYMKLKPGIVSVVFRLECLAVVGGEKKKKSAL